MKGDRIAQLELLLRSHPEGLKKSEIARYLGVHRSTAGRYIEELSQTSNVYEDKNSVRIRTKDSDEPFALSVYESLAMNMGAEMLANNSQFQNPHLASGLRKIATGMESYAPEIAKNIVHLADEIESKFQEQENGYRFSKVLDVLIDAWVTGRIVRIRHVEKEKEEETELAPYFIGFVENEDGRNPITVTGRLRHTAEIVTVDISAIRSVLLLDETYTIPDNLKAFGNQSKPDSVTDIIDTIHLVLMIREKSALNSFRRLAHSEFRISDVTDGKFRCEFDAENSIELILRIIQCNDSVEVVEPQKFRKKFIDMLRQILSIYGTI